MKYARIGLALLLAVSAVSWSQVPAVKLSESGICHDSRSPWFSRTQSFTPYPSLEACLAAGGRLPKGSDSNADSPPVAQGAEYQREYFGSGWADMDGDCRDARQEALAAQSTAPVRFDRERGCKVIAGRWISPFTGKAIHDPSAIDIDHLVPLSTARDTAREDSVDILVAFDGPATSKRYFGVQFYLEDLLKHPVDLVTDKALRPELRPFVEKEAIHVGIR